MLRRLFSGLAAALCLAAGPAFAEDPPLVAGAVYDPAIPSLESVVGHPTGADITRVADIRRYFEALRAAAPDRVAMGEIARTVEGRPTYWVALGSARNIARLDQIKANARALADPRRTTPAQAQAIIADQPVIVWLAFSVHGNEISPADASIALARHLLAARDATTQAYLQNTVVV
ncbi:MAG: zinc carboxypeptidase, partial [Brevundimonas sp.]